MPLPRSLALCLLALLPLAPLSGLGAADSLESGFSAPPPEFRPMVWWHWMNGSVTKESIRAELEDMKRVGIAGVQMLDIAPGFTKETMFPPGPIRWGTDAWHDHVQYAIRTADELGLKFGMHNCAGWSQSGGPWVTLDDSMKKVVWSETSVTGGRRVSLAMPQPEAILDYYRDIALLAVPADPAEAAPRPSVSSSPSAQVALEKLTDGLLTTEGVVTFPKGTRDLQVTLSFPEPVERRLLVITAPYQRGADVRLGGDLEVSDDGSTFRKVRSFGFPGYLFAHKGYIGGDLVLNVPFEPVRGRFFRIAFKGDLNPLAIAEITLSRNYRIENFQSKTLTSSLGSILPPANAPTQDAAAIPVNRVIDLTRRLKADGSVDWEAPPGRWTLLRIGYTTTGLPNHPSQDEGTGLEVDKMSRHALRRHWESSLGRILREAAPYVGRTFNSVLSDSWEAAQQNWTADFAREFLARRGYEITSYLPVLTGRVVGSLSDAEGFLADFRRTCSDLISENYFAELRRLASEHGLAYYGESYGGKTYNEFQAGKEVGVNMAEFWFWRDRSKFNVGGIKSRASLAHLKRSPLMAAESFTATQTEAGWAAKPSMLKPVGDLAFASGLTQIFMHSYVHQPYPNLMPGFTVGSSGSNFNRLNTWWPRANAWIDYLARCQFLLRQGDFVADVLLLRSMGIGSFAQDKFPAVPAGYDYDEADPVHLDGATATQDRIRMPGGMEYRVMALPSIWTADLALLRRLNALVQNGAAVVGPAPFSAAGKLDPLQRTEWKSLVERLWGAGGPLATRGHHDIAQALAALQVEPDCRIRKDDGTGPVNFLHRRSSEADIYFLATTSDKPVRFTADFRTGSREPELWDAVTGARVNAPAYRREKGRTLIDLTLGDSGSLFVVFRHPASAVHAVRVKDSTGAEMRIGEGLVAAGSGIFHRAPGGIRLEWSDGKTTTLAASPATEIALSGGWRVDFVSAFGERFTREFPRLQSWTEADETLKYFSGTAVYRATFDVNDKIPASGQRAAIDLGDVMDIATVTLNGQPVGIAWAPPYVLDITSALRKGSNSVEIEIRNRWVNRLMGDNRLPQDIEHQQKIKPSGRSWGIIAKFPDWMHDPARIAQRQRATFVTYQPNYKPDDTLPGSGLMGPVRILIESRLDPARP